MLATVNLVSLCINVDLVEWCYRGRSIINGGRACDCDVNCYEGDGMGWCYWQAIREWADANVCRSEGCVRDGGFHADSSGMGDKVG